jgi:hypothetical protein
MEPEGSLPHSQVPATCRYPEPAEYQSRSEAYSLTLSQNNTFDGEELLAPRPTPKLEEPLCRLSATAYSIYSQLPSILEARNLRTRHAVVTVTCLSRMYHGCITDVSRMYHGWITDVTDVHILPPHVLHLLIRALHIFRLLMIVALDKGLHVIVLPVIRLHFSVSHLGSQMRKTTL